MQFSPVLIPALIIGPLRYFFARYPGNSKFIWDADEKKRTVDIGHFNDFFKVPLEERPRILVSRGPFQASKVGITDNMAEEKAFKDTMGLKDRINMMLYSGTASVIVEARNMGTCELLADMACHFLAWARPEICDTQGFKDFILPMNVGECQQVEKENTEKFQVQIGLPWIKEEQWRVQNDGIAIKNSIANVLVNG
jgi:hypothetical protein